jgi:hypothetical protein
VKRTRYAEFANEIVGFWLIENNQPLINAHYFEDNPEMKLTAKVGNDRSFAATDHSEV